MASNRFSADYAKRVAGCKKCKEQIAKGLCRLAKISPNPFVQNPDGGPPPDMKQYFHPKCLFETFAKARAATKVIDEVSDIEGYADLEKADKEEIVRLIEELEESRRAKGEKTPKGKKKAATTDTPQTTPKTPAVKPTPVSVREQREEKRKVPREEGDKKEESKGKEEETKKEEKKRDFNENSKHNAFHRFCLLCETISRVSKYTEKSKAVELYITKKGFDGDLLTLLRLLLPSIDQRVYNIKEKQLLKHFSAMWDLNLEELTEDYNHSGDVSATLRKFFEENKLAKTEKGDWSIMKVDRWLGKLANLSGDQEQSAHLQFATKRLSPLEVQYLLRLIKKDLRINAGVKHILDGVHPSAYEAFQSCRDLETIVRHWQNGTEMPVGLRLGTAVLPMLAEPCKSVEQAMASCKGSLYTEIKYDGERVQLHKDGHEFSYFSRSLKPVQAYKMEQLNEEVPKAFPGGDSLILDAEVLLVDTVTGKPLPFGTLGVHKKDHFKDASVCLFVFDILFYNGESLLKKPLAERKTLLKKHMKEVRHRVQFSEYEIVKNGDNRHLKGMIFKAIDDGLEGLVIKDAKSIYEPGKRHWLKVKKDYLEQGAMADTADLIVLGAYYGTGSKGGLMSVFLMGVHDASTGKFLTVTKVGNGHTDDALERINKELKGKMTKTTKAMECVPKWLRIKKDIPDFVAVDPQDMPVWEITGAEYTRTGHHTADGISIRFPRVTKIRSDKNWQSATSLEELKKLYELSKTKSDVDEAEDLDDEYAIPLYEKHSIAQVEEEEGEEEEEEESKEGEAREKRSTGEAKGKGDTSTASNKDKKRKRKIAEEEDESAEEEEEEEEEMSESEESAQFTDEEEEEEEERRKTAKKRKVDGKPECKYGKDCYRKNPQHRKEFSHPK